MKSRLGFIRTTLLGGVLYLVPIVILVIVVAKALHLAKVVVGPMAGLFPVKTIAGVALAELLAIAAIVIFCFLTGLFARTVGAKKIISWLEVKLLSNMPGYEWIKDLSEAFAGIESAKAYEPVLARIKEAWQVAFVVERIGDRYVAVFVPGAPSPWSGAVFFMPEDRIKPLDVPLPEALKCLRRLGLGSGALLKGKL